MSQDRKRGRPRKEQDMTDFWQFRRAGQVLYAYNEARKSGEKHRAAIPCVVDQLKQHNPEAPISETGVRRILATFQSKNVRFVLRFERKPLTEEEIEKHCVFRRNLAILEGKKGPELEEASNPELVKKSKRFVFGFSDRPNYPRHNRRTP